MTGQELREDGWYIRNHKVATASGNDLDEQGLIRVFNLQRNPALDGSHRHETEPARISVIYDDSSNHKRTVRSNWIGHGGNATANETGQEKNRG